MPLASDISPASLLGSAQEGLAIAAQDSETVRYTYFAFLALLIYDHIITFDIEVEVIWTSKWSLPKVLFLINRYIVPPMLFFNAVGISAPNLSKSFCGFYEPWQSWPTAVSIATVEAILVLRVYAICARSKTILRFLVALFSCNVATMFGMALAIQTSPQYRHGQEILSLPLALPGCYGTPAGFLWGFWIPPLIFEGVIIILTVYQAFRLMGYPSGLQPTLMLFVRDSMMYFLFMFGTLLANAVFFKVGSATRTYRVPLLICPSTSIACIAVARMMMNMRTLDISDNYQLPSMRTITFATTPETD